MVQKHHRFRNIQPAERVDFDRFTFLPIDQSKVHSSELVEALEEDRPPDADDGVELRGRHESHIEKRAFTYFIREPIPKRYQHYGIRKHKLLGCITLAPLPSLGLEKALLNKAVNMGQPGKIGVVVNLWVSPSQVEHDLDKEVIDTLIPWLSRDWGFEPIVFEIWKSRQRHLAHYLQDKEFVQLTEMGIMEPNANRTVYLTLRV